MTDTMQIAAIIEAALKGRALANAAVPEDNPYVNHTTEQLARGVQKYADNIPAVSKTAAGDLGYRMEQARVAGMDEGRRHRRAVSAQRRQRTRQRQAMFEEVAARQVTPNPERVTAAWGVVVHLLPIVGRVAVEKRQWATRFLGSITDDLTQVVLEKMVLVLAKSDWDLAVLTEAAAELADQERLTQRIPGDQGNQDDAERQHRKAMRKARKELMSMVNYWTLTTLVDLYRETRNLRWENLDLLDTVAASISGVGADPLVAHTKADRAPAMLGASFQRPGGPDPHLIAQAINAAITDRGLDRLTELLLAEDNRRTDGSFKWRELAEQVFRAGPDGDDLWTDVERATANLEVPGRARAAAARRYVRGLFSWMPGFIVDLVEAFDPRPLMWGQGRMIMASEFEMRLADVDPLGERRYPLRPALTFASAREAAKALVENLDQLITGEEFVRSVQHA